MTVKPPEDHFDLRTADRIEIPTVDVFDDGDQITDFLREGDTPLVTEFIDQNRDRFQIFFDRALAHEIDLDVLIDGLDSELPEIVNQCRDVIHLSLDRYGPYLHKVFFEAPSPAAQLNQIVQHPEQGVQDIAEANLAMPEKRQRTSPVSLRKLTGIGSLVAAAAVAGNMYFGNGTQDDNHTPISLGDSYNGAAVVSMETDPLRDILEPLTTTDPLQSYDAASDFDHGGVDDLRINSDGNIFYQDWDVPADVYEANMLTAQITGLDQSYTYAVQALESSFNPNAFNRIDACGLGQFVPSTLAEKTYRYAGMFGYEGIRERLVERFVDSRDEENRPIYGYRFTSDLAQTTMYNLCLDPHFNTRLIAYMQMEDIGRLQRNLSEFAPEGSDHYPVTVVQAYTAHFAGRTAAENMIINLHTDDGEAIAADFFSEVAQNNATNQKLLYHPHTITNEEGVEIEVPNLEDPRTVNEFFTFLSEEKGLSFDVLPNYTNRRAIVNNIVANVEALGLETTNVAYVSAPLRSLRPEPRPNNRSFDPNLS